MRAAEDGWVAHMVVGIQGDPYGRGIVYVDSKFEVAFSCKVGLLHRHIVFKDVDRSNRI